MSHADLFYLLALQRVVGIGDIMAKKLIAKCGSVAEVFEAKPRILRTIDGIGETLIKNLRDKRIFNDADIELSFIERNHIDVVVYSDDNYPDRLKHCIDGPLLLFTTGNFNWQTSRVISIVGTRQITAYGMGFCKELIAALAPLNLVIVSGFAYGVDIVAHRAAIDNGLQTWGVLAHGLDHIYPKAHQRYMSQMKENGGFISEFWSGNLPEKENFVKRNRIVAGISEATIVVESAEKGGSLITANMANGYNRDVFAVPGRADDKYSIGCNNLIKTQKAQMITHAGDLVYMLNWEIKEPGKVVQKQLFVDLDDEEQKVHQYLLSHGRQLMDLIALECEFPIYKISALLLKMELKGVVRPLPGKLFEAI